MDNSQLDKTYINREPEGGHGLIETVIINVGEVRRLFAELVQDWASADKALVEECSCGDLSEQDRERAYVVSDYFRRMDAVLEGNVDPGPRPMPVKQADTVTGRFLAFGPQGFVDMGTQTVTVVSAELETRFDVPGRFEEGESFNADNDASSE